MKQGARHVKAVIVSVGCCAGMGGSLSANEHASENVAAYQGKPMSLDFQDIQVRHALMIIADFTGMNVVVSDGVSGAMTLRLRDVPWDQVLEIITQARGLSQRRQGNVIWVAPRAEVAAAEKLELETRLALENLQPLQTRAFALNYAKAAQVMQYIQSAPSTVALSLPSPPTTNSVAVPIVPGTKMLSVRGSVMAEPRTNQLFVTDVQARLEDVTQMIARIDIPLRQVMIEARIVQANQTFGRSLGARLGGDFRDGVSVQTLPQGGTSSTSTGANSANWVNLPALGHHGVNAAQWGVSIFNATRNQVLNLELSALESDGRGKVISSPRVVTANQAKATIEQGTELPYQTVSSNGVTSVAFRKANLKLEVTPQITPEGGIVMDLDIHKDGVGQVTPAGMAIDTRRVSTQVRVEDGGTVMIGGIYETSAQNDQYKVPFLGDLPVLGHFFKNQRTLESRQELLVFITPKMLENTVFTR